MGSQTWSVELDGGGHIIQLDHSYWSGRNVLWIDNAIVVRHRPGLLGLMAHCSGLTELSTPVKGHEVRVLISPTDTFDLVIDGRSVTSGEPVPPLPAPRRDALTRLGNIGAITCFIALPLIFISTFVFGRFAPDWGPRWFAANDLVLTAGIVPFMAGFGVFVVSLARSDSALASRMLGLAIGIAGLWTSVVAALALPGDISEVIGEPEIREVTVVESITRESGARAIRTADGVTYEWKTSYGLYEYPKLGPGTYLVVLTPARHRIVAVQPVN